MITESSLMDDDSTFVLSTTVDNKERESLPLPEFDLQIENGRSTISDENNTLSDANMDQYTKKIS